MTVNVAEALFPLASVALTICAPAEAVEGMTKVEVKAPEASVVTVAGLVVCAAPLNAIVTMEEGARPAPVTVTVVPTGP